MAGHRIKEAAKHVLKGLFAKFKNYLRSSWRSDPVQLCHFILYIVFLILTLGGSIWECSVVWHSNAGQAVFYVAVMSAAFFDGLVLFTIQATHVHQPENASGPKPRPTAVDVEVRLGKTTAFALIAVGRQVMYLNDKSERLKSLHLFMLVVSYAVPLMILFEFCIVFGLVA